VHRNLVFTHFLDSGSNASIKTKPAGSELNGKPSKKSLKSMQNSSKTKNTSVVETSKSKPAFARKPRIITESAIVGLSSAPVTICATSKPSKQTVNVKTQSKSQLVRRPTGTINAKIFQQVLGYPESLHSNILGRVRTAYDRWELNVQYDGDGNPKTNKIIGFMKKSSVKIGGAIQDVSPSTTLLRVAQESV